MSDCDERTELTDEESLGTSELVLPNQVTCAEISAYTRANLPCQTPVVNFNYFVEHAENVDCSGVRRDNPPENIDLEPETECVTEELKQKLQKVYNDVTLPCVSWMDEGEDYLLSDYYVLLQLCMDSSAVNLEEIFSSVAGTPPTRILIEGQPGYGKTTLASKLVCDWAKGKPYLQRFDLAFLVPLRELEGHSIRQFLTAIVEDIGFSNTEKLLDVIRDNECETLLILDGLDEVLDIEKNDVKKILYGQLYDKMTVVTTCRTGCFNPKARKLRGVSVRKEFHDKLIQILGIDVDHRINFLRRFIKTDVDNTLQRVQNLLPLQINLFQSPLMLILLSYFVVMNIDVVGLTTQTIIYKTFVNFIIRRTSETRKDIILDESFSIFGCGKEGLELEYQTTFRQFGKLSYDKVLSKDLQFEYNDLTTTIYDMGFLAHHKKTISFKSEQKYEIFHLSLLEFCAAFALSCEFEDNNCQFKDETIQTITGHQFHRPLFSPLESISSLLPFLIGLLQEKSSGFFKQIEPFAYRFTVDSSLIWSALSQYNTGNDLSAMMSFMPPYILTPSHTFIITLQSTMKRNVLRECSYRKSNFRVNTMIQDVADIPQDIAIPNFKFSTVCCKKFDDHQVHQLKNIQCKYLQFLFLYYSEEFDTECLLRTFCSMQAEKKALIIDELFAWTTMFKIIHHITMTDLRLSHLNVELNPTSSKRMKAFVDFLKLDRVEVLVLKIKGDLPTEDIENIMKICSGCQFMHSLDIHQRQRMDFDLCIITNNGHKRWKSLTLNASEINWSEEPENRDCIECLILNPHCRNVKEAVSKVDLQVLECDCPSVFCMYTEVTEILPSFKSVVELMLNLDCNARDIELWSTLAHFKQLQVFGITIKFNTPSYDIIIYIVSCLQSMSIKRFVIRFSSEKEKHLTYMTDNTYLENAIFFTCQLLQCFKENSEDFRTHSLSIVDIILPVIHDIHQLGDIAYSVPVNNLSVNNLVDVTMILLQCIKLDILQNVNIMNVYTQELFFCDFVHSLVVDYSIIKAEHNVCCSDEMSPKYYKTLFGDVLSGPSTQLSFKKINTYQQ